MKESWRQTLAMDIQREASKRRR